MPVERSPRRKPLKRQRLGGTTISLQRLSSGHRKFAVVVHMPDGSRHKREYVTEGEARTAYDLRAREAQNIGTAAASQVDDGDKRAVADFKAAVAAWPTVPSVAEALAFFLEHRSAVSAGQTVAEAVEERLTDATNRRLSRRHLSDLESRLGRFRSSFGERYLSTLTTDEVAGWIRSLAVGPESQRNFRKAVGSLFAAAVEAGRMARNPVRAVKVAKPAPEEPGTISPSELARLLAALPQRSRAVVAIQALAGLRAAEAARLDWRDVRLGERLIVVSAAKAKTAARRLVPICDTLAAWLAPLGQLAGSVAPTGERLRNDMEAARAAAGIQRWPQNALRHSCASAWAATEPDVARVASWLGNSPSVVHAHYRALWTEAEGRRWLDVLPARCNLVAFSGATAS